MLLSKCNICAGFTPIDTSKIPPNSNLIQQLHLVQTVSHQRYLHDRHALLSEKAKVELLKKELDEAKQGQAKLREAVVEKETELSRSAKTHAKEKKCLSKKNSELKKKSATDATHVARLEDDLAAMRNDRDKLRATIKQIRQVQIRTTTVEMKKTMVSVSVGVNMSESEDVPSTTALVLKVDPVAIVKKKKKTKKKKKKKTVYRRPPQTKKKNKKRKREF